MAVEGLGKPCKYKPGDIVDLSRWDATERLWKKMGDSRVVRVYEGLSESGWILDVVSLSGRQLSGMCENWFCFAETVKEEK